jgi:hypothetical protein
MESHTIRQGIISLLKEIVFDLSQILIYKWLL